MDTLPLAVRAIIAGEEVPKENSDSILLLTDSDVAGRSEEYELPVSLKGTDRETHINSEKDLTEVILEDTILRGATLEGNRRYEVINVLKEACLKGITKKRRKWYYLMVRRVSQAIQVNPKLGFY